MLARYFYPLPSCLWARRGLLWHFTRRPCQFANASFWLSFFLLLPLIMKGVASSAELLTGLARAKHIGSIVDQLRIVFLLLGRNRNVGVLLLAQQGLKVDVPDFNTGVGGHLFGDVAAIFGDSLDNLVQDVVLRNLEEKLWACCDALQITDVRICTNGHTEYDDRVVMLHISRFFRSFEVNIAIRNDDEKAAGLAVLLQEQLPGFYKSIGEIRVATFLGEVYQSFCHLPRGALEAHLDAGLGVVLHEAHVHLVSSNVEPSDGVRDELLQVFPVCIIHTEATV
mmetsp:Transcript_28070/g.66639  ORF Transcript_28070/g.66639 Transcript_28070/m.66639 type:complete len:282 (-) Transcript_28070:96-941(-)